MMAVKIEQNKPKLFVGSSTEGLAVARQIQISLDYDCVVNLWTQGIFGPSKGTLESFISGADQYDFAVLVLTPDDSIISRDKKEYCPRDNVLFELGLFMGRLGRERTFFLYDRKIDLKLPSDLDGITPITYEIHKNGSLESSMGAATSIIINNIKKLGQRNTFLYLDRPQVTSDHQGICDFSFKKRFPHVDIQCTVPAATSAVFPNRNVAIKKIPSLLKQFSTKLHAKYRNVLPDENFEEKTIVLINGTRISTFVSFTDGERLLLFDRFKGKDKTTVYNPCDDVFGSVPFENNSIFDKIRNNSFFECISEDINIMPGFVFEDNIISSESESVRETVIMFGYHIFLKPEDLEKGIISTQKNILVKMFDINCYQDSPGTLQLTAKARHAIESLIELKKHNNTMQL